jgi:hypothetical protein
MLPASHVRFPPKEVNNRMPGPLVNGVTLGGLLDDLPALRGKPRIGAEKASSLLSDAGPRTRRKLATTAEHDVVPVTGGPQ